MAVKPFMGPISGRHTKSTAPEGHLWSKPQLPSHLMNLDAIEASPAYIPLLSRNLDEEQSPQSTRC